MSQKEKQSVSRRFDFFEDSQTEKPAQNSVKKLGGVMNSLKRKSNVLYIRKEISPGSNTIDEGNTIIQKGANVNTTM